MGVICAPLGSESEYWNAYDDPDCDSPLNWPHELFCDEPEPSCEEIDELLRLPELPLTP